MTTNNKGNKIPNVPTLRFPEFKEEWNENVICSIAEVVGGGTPDTNIPEFWDGNIIWYTPSEIGKEKYCFSSLRTISENGLRNSSAKILPKGTILLSSRATIGEVSITINECSTNQGFQSLIAKDNINNEYLYYLILTQKHNLYRKACGSTFLEISANEIRKLKVCFPSKAEQEKIANFLSLVDERIETQSKIIEDLKLLRLGLYHKIFANIKGKLTPLHSICKIVKGKQINVTELTNIGKYYVMNGGVVPSGYYDEYNTPANTISISEGGNCGYVQYNKVPFWSGGHCYTLQLEDNVNTLYLYHLLKFKEKDIMALRIGSCLPNIQKKDLENFSISIPENILQKKYADIFDTLQQKEDTETELLNMYKQQKKYLLQNMFI